jgi:hypothetical protein
MSLPSRKIPATNFCLMLSRLQGQSAAGRFRSFEKSSDIKRRTLDLPACSRMPQQDADLVIALVGLVVLLVIFFVLFGIPVLF